jgi:hypothetical protein
MINLIIFLIVAMYPTPILTYNILFNKLFFNFNDIIYHFNIQFIGCKLKNNLAFAPLVIIDNNVNYIYILILLLLTLLIYYFYQYYFKLQLLTWLCLHIKNDKLNKLFNRLLIKYITKNNINLGLEILEYEYNKNRDILNIKLKNSLMLPYYKLLPNIYLTLATFEEFNTFSENKIFISSGQTIYGNYFMLHNNFLINKNTTLLHFYEDFTPNYNHLSLTNYAINDITIILIKVFNLDDIKNKHIKLNSKPTTQSRANEHQIRRYSTTAKHPITKTLNYITPLKSKLNINLSTIISMDIETIQFNDDIQIPILITAAYYDKYNNIKNIHTLINNHYLSENVNLSIKDL